VPSVTLVEFAFEVVDTSFEVGDLSATLPEQIDEADQQGQRGQHNHKEQCEYEQFGTTGRDLEGDHLAFL
jgi:hypothetical protein